ncbi:MAG TPA: SPFH domain-containing protein [Phycisphaerae bacterium]|nr:SPFH domain-containing protein [Phycisphaerae bacterium]
MVEPSNTPLADEPPGAEAASVDTATSSMGNALRMSFRLLTVIMMVVVVLFALTGVTAVRSNEKGIKTIFGRNVGVVGPGLQYTWPFPVGKIEKIAVSEQGLTIRDFWMYEAPGDVGKDLSERPVVGNDLRAGLDGALLTGDSYLLHARIVCSYVIKDVVAYRQNVVDPDEAITAAVCSAAIHAAATRTADGLMTAEQGPFVQQTVSRAQEILNRLGAGVRITKLNVIKPTWPLRALPDYAAALQAAQRRDSMESDARGEAGKALQGAAGPNYRKLVGVPYATRPEEWRDERAKAVSGEFDLIGEYERARARKDDRQAEMLLARIDEVLERRTTQGEVTSILSAAGTYRDNLKQAVMARASRVEKLLPAYRQAPSLLLEQEWRSARARILDSPTVVKWYLSPGNGKTVVQINTPPEIEKELLRRRLQADKDRQQAPSGGR